tara:strand:+ start:188 stop:289 length:102 start_codon:yes stop_codon:yes gene_type:complete
MFASRVSVVDVGDMHVELCRGGSEEIAFLSFLW